MQKSNQANYTILAFALIKFLVPFFLIDSQFELHRDEYLYLADADHLAWGYIEMPPMLAWLGYISNLLGGSVYSVYLWGSLFGGLTMFLVGKIVIQLKGKTFAVFIACLAFQCSGFLRMHILFQPNFLDVFFWTLSTYLIIKWIDTEDKNYLYGLGVCFGFGILGKYTTAFYVIAFLGSVVFTERRKWLLSKHFYFSMLVGLVICSPNLYWQYTHHFPVLHHMDLLTNQQLKYNSRIDFLANQFLMALPSFFIWLAGIWYLFMKKEGRKYIAIGFIYLGIIALLLYFNGKGYYAAAIYPSLMAFGGIWFSKLAEEKRLAWVRWAAPVFMLLITGVTLPMALPILSPEKLAGYYRAIHIDQSSVLRWEDHKQHPLPQDFADMLGWKEMAEKTAKIYHTLPDSIKNQTMIYGDNYGEAGALGFYGKKLGLPQIYSDNASYVFWLPENFTQKYFLFICDQLPDADDAFFNHWGKREILDSVTQKYAREFGAKIVLYSQPDDFVRIIAEQHMRQSRNQFNFK